MKFQSVSTAPQQKLSNKIWGMKFHIASTFFFQPRANLCPSLQKVNQTSMDRGELTDTTLWNQLGSVSRVMTVKTYQQNLRSTNLRDVCMLTSYSAGKSCCHTWNSSQLITQHPLSFALWWSMDIYFTDERKLVVWLGKKNMQAIWNFIPFLLGKRLHFLKFSNLYVQKINGQHTFRDMKR